MSGELIDNDPLPEDYDAWLLAASDDATQFACLVCGKRFRTEDAMWQHDCEDVYDDDYDWDDDPMSSLYWDGTAWVI